MSTSPIDDVSGPAAWSDRYVDIINRGAYGELRALFSDEAVFYTPTGRTLRGADEISDFYTGFLPTLHPRVRISSRLVGANETMFALAASTDDEPTEFIGAVDHVTVDDTGRAVRMMVFTRPAGSP